MRRGNIKVFLIRDACPSKASFKECVLGTTPHGFSPCQKQGRRHGFPSAIHMACDPQGMWLSKLPPPTRGKASRISVHIPERISSSCCLPRGSMSHLWGGRHRQITPHWVTSIGQPQDSPGEAGKGQVVHCDHGWEWGTGVQVVRGEQADASSLHESKEKQLWVVGWTSYSLNPGPPDQGSLLFPLSRMEPSRLAQFWSLNMRF